MVEKLWVVDRHLNHRTHFGVNNSRSPAPAHLTASALVSDIKERFEPDTTQVGTTEELQEMGYILLAVEAFERQ